MSETETQESAPETPKRTLEESLAELPEDTRNFVLKEVSSARSEAKNLRDRWKAAEPKLTQFEQLAQASKTEAERSAEALQEAQQKAVKATQRVAKAEIKAALSTVVSNASDIVDDLDLSRFIDDDGEIDTQAVQALQQKYAVFNAARPPKADRSQGSGSTGVVSDPGQVFAEFIQRKKFGG